LIVEIVKAGTTVLLICVLVAREFSTLEEGAAAARRSRALGVAALPLIVGFALICGSKILEVTSAGR
jgi:hypothetical protein